MATLILNQNIVKGVLGNFPETFTMDEFIARVIIASKLDKALEQLDKGEYLTEEELDEEIKKWN